MKYKAGAVTINGETKWAVVTGKKYFPQTLSDSKDEAHLWAIKQSAMWHAKKVRELSNEFELLGGGVLSECCYL